MGQNIVTGPFKVLRQVKEGDKVIIEKEGDGKKGGPKAAPNSASGNDNRAAVQDS